MHGWWFATEGMGVTNILLECVDGVYLPLL